MTMYRQCKGRRKRKKSAGGRKLTTALLTLRAVQVGLSIADMSLLTAGQIFDLYAEMGVDDKQANGPRIATQADFDAF